MRWAMGWPQLVMLGLIMWSFGMDCARHGEPKTGTHDGRVSFVAAVISFAILWAGGFWTGGGQ